MPYIVPFQLAFETPLGKLFFFLSIFLAFLTSFYFFLKARLKQNDAASFYFESYFSKIEQQKIPFTPLSTHMMGIFARQTRVEDNKGKQALLLCFYPHLVNDATCMRFQSYTQKIKMQIGLEPYAWIHTQDNLWMSVSKKFVCPQHSQYSLYELLFDKQLTQADKEWILLELAKRLSRLHQVQIDSTPLYHGLLNPHTILVTLDKDRIPEKVNTLLTGLAYALGPFELQAHFQQIFKRSLKLDALTYEQASRAFNFLAPEQKNQSLASDVAKKSDIYSFASIAYYAFTHTAYESESSILTQEAIPEGWRDFLKQALSVSTSERPLDFELILNLVAQPELNLSFSHDPEPSAQTKEDEKDIQSISIKDLFIKTRAQPQIVVSKPQTRVDKEAWLKKNQQAEYAFNASNWSEAKSHYLELLKLKPEEAKVLTQLAIVSFELKNYDEARNFYSEAKKYDAKVAKCYREHILS